MEFKKLRLVLKANAIFSFTSGLTMLVFNQWLSSLMNIQNNSVFLILGVGLLFFGGSVYWNAIQENISKKKIKLIIWQDWAWVFGSAALILTQAFDISKLGFIIIGVVALIIADFAIFQQKYLHSKA